MNNRQSAPYAEKELDRPKLVVLSTLFLLLLIGAIWPQLTIFGLFLMLLIGTIYRYQSAGD